jgi:hypothetical protein
VEIATRIALRSSTPGAEFRRTKRCTLFSRFVGVDLDQYVSVDTRIALWQPGC